MRPLNKNRLERYLEERGKTAKVRANREKALFSHVFNFARECGYTDAPNPCAGIKGHKETGRDRYIEDTEFFAVWNKAHFEPRSSRHGRSDALFQDGNGQRLTYGALRSRFDKAREAAGVSFQFRDIRAKTATDTENLGHAQKLLGHKTKAMTEHYTRNRKGEKVNPLNEVYQSRLELR